VAAVGRCQQPSPPEMTLGPVACKYDPARSASEFTSTRSRKGQA
jgi:hypothetical protein